MKRILAYCWRARRQVLLTLLFTCILGEGYLRVPFLPQRLEYQPDPELGAELAPSQTGFMWLANASLQSPPITMNDDGHRGAPTDWSRPFVLTIGDSEWFGDGVTDAEVWTNLLQADLRRRPRMETLQVVNASKPGYGAYHNSVVIRRELERHRPAAILVRVSIAQRSFLALTPAEQQRGYQAARVRQQVRRVTRFGPFLLAKLQAQIPSIRTALVPHFLRATLVPGELDPAVGVRMFGEQREWWERIAQLADGAGVPLVFVVDDIEALPGSLDLARQLGDLAQHHASTHVIRLGPERFGLHFDNPDDLRRVVRTTLRLERDPHANAKHHALLADAIGQYLEESGLLASIAGGSGRDSSPQGTPRSTSR